MTTYKIINLSIAKSMGNSNDLTRRFYGGGLRGSAVFLGRFLKIIGRFGNKKGTDLKMVVQNSFLIFKEYAYNKKQDTRSHKQISCTIFIHLTSLKTLPV